MNNTDTIAAQLRDEGFREDAITHALTALKEAPDVQRPVPWCRKVAESFVARGRAKRGLCGECVQGWLLEEREYLGRPCDYAVPCPNCKPESARVYARGELTQRYLNSDDREIA